MAHLKKIAHWAPAQMRQRHFMYSPVLVTVTLTV